MATHTHITVPREIDHFDKQDLKRCLQDWYDRGSLVLKKNHKLNAPYRKLHKKPWATEKWVRERDFKLFRLMSEVHDEHTLNTLFFNHENKFLIPRSPKLKASCDNFEHLRRGKIFKQKCERLINRMRC